MPKHSFHLNLTKTNLTISLGIALLDNTLKCGHLKDFIKSVEEILLVAQRKGDKRITEFKE
ncbi:MAG: hypothetical protein JRJ23_04435 [Deltaproteobacteria bacterium]|nr:hypothetical protein [Deltaproteobacteria bacterium]